MLEREVALKVMLPETAGDPEQKQRFEREARAVARLSHPGIVTVFDLGYHTDGSPYIVMELLKGQDLLGRLREGPPVLDPTTGFSFHTTPGQTFDLATDGSTLPSAAYVPDDPDFEGYVIVAFDAFDEWREEDDLLVGHARDPFTTIDTRRSSRRVVVEIAGRTVADSTRTTMLSGLRPYFSKSRRSLAIQKGGLA